MSVSQEQLGEIQRQLGEHFLSHPAISIMPTKGNPPEQYEITYNISGFIKQGKGEAILSQIHKIELTIPFGFPHFPPSCKPKTAIFHPDFDPAAICLGDFWQQHSQISDLIIFIGKLINGESYSTNNAFNEEAATWYQAHKDAFPIAKIQWQNSQGIEALSFEEAKSEIDTIDETDLASGFDLLSLEDSLLDEDLEVNTGVAAMAAPSENDLGFLQLLENQKKFYKLQQSLDKGGPFSDQMEKLSAHAVEEIQKAEDLYRSAKKAENVGNLKNAARLFKEVAEIAADFPNLEVDLKRVSQSLELLEKTPQLQAQTQGNDLLVAQPENKKSTANLTTKGRTNNKKQAPPVRQQESFLAEKRLSGKRLLALATGFISLFLVTGGIYYFYTVRQLESSSISLRQCTAEIDNRQFEAAKASCTSALENLPMTVFSLQKRAKDLKQNINKILDSETLSQGLAGKILVDGQYLQQKDAAIIMSYKQLLKEGQDFFDKENWTQAEERFTKIITIANNNTLIPPTALEEIKGKIGFIRFSIIFASANDLLAKQKWQEASLEIKKAKSLLEALPEEARQKYAVELSSALAKCNFEEFRKQGDDFFSKADWQNAISSYKSVLPSGVEGKIAPQEMIDAVRGNISRAELYATIDNGNKAFISGAWEEAIQEYNKAVALLNANQDIIKLADAQVTRKKIDRIILQTTIIRDRLAAKAQQDEQKNLSAARNFYRQIITNINNSNFANEAEFLETKKVTNETIQVLEKSIYQADKEQYLKDNFRNLFAVNYPTAIPESLNNPVISFVREAGGKMIFKMQCTESGRGRPLTLIMMYAYDKAANRWEFFSEKQ